MKRKILVADSSDSTLQTIFNCHSSSNYEIQVATTGQECLTKIAEWHPDLIIVDLLLPQIHGIDMLRRIRSNASTSQVGVIIVASLSTIQNQQAAIDHGANYFLTKPFEGHHLFLLIERFFLGHLQCNKSIPVPIKYQERKNIHQPPAATSYIKFWGTRGSNPVSGARYLHFGGNTCCLEVRYKDAVCVIDAGTGICDLGDLLSQQLLQNKSDLAVFIGHTHWDHITGFPFFLPLYKRMLDITVRAPHGYTKSIREIFNDTLSYGYFPLSMDNIYAHVTFEDLTDESIFQIGEITISCQYANHPGPTLCFKIQTPTKTIGYVTDNEVLFNYFGPIAHLEKSDPLFEPHLRLIQFLSGCDIIVHEAQYFAHEYYDRAGWGHSSINNATAFIKQLNCKEWIVTHHDPHHSDEDLRNKEQLHLQVLKECNMPVKLTMAYDGMIVPL